MFLFRSRRNSDAADAWAEQQRAAQQRSTTPPPADSAAGDEPQREFFAFKAVRALGGAARKMGGAAARLVKGPSAEALTVEVETRSQASGEAFAAAITEWARLLAANDDSLRYEQPNERPMTYRAAFLRSRGLELALENASRGSETGPGWPSFLKNTTLPDGDELAKRLPELLAAGKDYPDLAPHVDAIVASLKADARHEQLRGERAAAGSRAEEIRTATRGSRAAEGKKEVVSESCKSSAEALAFYTAFRRHQMDAADHLRLALTKRRTQLSTAYEALAELGAQTAAAKATAEQQLAQIQVQREQATAGPRQAAAALERDGTRLASDSRVRECEERRRGLQVQLEEVSQALALHRDQRLQLLRRRDEAVSMHRLRAQEVESQLQSLRPARFHRVLTSRADAMTEGEITAGLARSAEAARSTAEEMASLAQEQCAHRLQEFTKKDRATQEQIRLALRQHARMELSRLEAAAITAGQAATDLIEDANMRSSRLAMGVGDYDDRVPNRQKVRALRKALAAAQAAWDEVSSVWGGSGTETGAQELLEHGSGAELWEGLREARERLAPSLAALQDADPMAYDLAVNERLADDIDLDELDHATLAESSRTAALGAPPSLPHGWDAHATPEGHVYYYSKVTGQTQWEPPREDAAVAAGWRMFQAEDGAWFYHDPYSGDGVWWPELPTRAAAPTGQDALESDALRG